ncbi:MAG: hypothetical protein WBN10_05400 [Polyangiales bacterium]
MKRLAHTCSLLLFAAAPSGCKSVGHTETAAQPSMVPVDAATTSESEADPPDDDVFVSKVVGFSIRKPSSWYFVPTAWGATQPEYKSEDLAHLLRENATEPLVGIHKDGDMMNPIGPVFRANYRSLGHLINMSAEEIAETVIAQRRRSFDAYELIGGVEHTEVSGHDAVRFVSSFSVGGDPSGLTRAGARAVVAENWIVKRGRYFFALESMAPRKDSSPRELRAIFDSIVIEPRD